MLQGLLLVATFFLSPGPGRRISPFQVLLNASVNWLLFSGDRGSEVALVKTGDPDRKLSTVSSLSNRKPPVFTFYRVFSRLAPWSLKYPAIVSNCFISQPECDKLSPFHFPNSSFFLSLSVPIIIKNKYVRLGPWLVPNSHTHEIKQWGKIRPTVFNELNNPLRKVTYGISS